MSSKTPEQSPLWAQVLQDRKAKAFLKKHPAEFPRNSFFPQPIAFPELSIPSSFMSDVIKAAMPFAKPETQRLAALFLDMPARRIAKELGWPRKKVYFKLRNLKRLAMRRFRTERKEALNARKRTRRLDTTPHLIALRTISLALHDKQQEVFLIELDGNETWVDAAGKAFKSDVQEILNNLEEYGIEFEVLDVNR